MSLVNLVARHHDQGISLQALVQVSNSRLSLSDDIWFHVEQLHGTVKPGTANTPVSLENLAAFEVQVDSARLRISDAVLQALVQAELQRTDAPLRITTAVVPARAPHR